MTEYASSDLFNIFLGQKSSLCGSFYNSESFSLSVDFQSNFVRPSAESQNLQESDVLWDEKINKIDVCTNKVKEVNPYSPNPDLHWSILTDISDKRVVELKHCNYFESFHSGLNFFVENNLSDVFEDKIRYQIEKCDVFRGFVSIYDVDSGYSGFLAVLMPLLDDAFDRKPKLTFGVGTEEPNLFELDAVALSSVCSFLYWPNFKDSFKGLLCQDSAYHTSAVLSVFLQQALRITERGTEFKDFITFLSPLSRNIITSYLGVPFDDSEDRNLATLFSSKFLKNNIVPISMFTKQLPLQLPLHYTYLSSCGIQGISNNHQFFSSLAQLTSESQVFTSTTRYCYSPRSLSIPDFFPQFFGDKILSDGRLRAPHQRVRCNPVKEIPTISVLQNSNQPVQLIQRVLSRRVKVNESSELIAAGVLEDDVSDIKQRLNELADNYSLT